MKNAEKLIKDVNKKLETTEYRMVKMKGVSLSVADLEQLKLYAEAYISNGGNFYGLMSPLGEVKQVLDAYGLKSA